MGDRRFQLSCIWLSHFFHPFFSASLTCHTHQRHRTDLSGVYQTLTRQLDATSCAYVIHTKDMLAFCDHLALSSSPPSPASLSCSLTTGCSLFTLTIQVTSRA